MSDLEQEQEQDIDGDERPEWEKGRYIDVHGDAVHASKLSKIFNSVDFITTAGAVTVAAVVTDSNPWIVSVVAGVNFLSCWGGRLFEHNKIKEKIGDRVIDTRP